MASERAQIIRNMKKMGELSTQLVDANKTIRDLEQQLALAQDQVIIFLHSIDVNKDCHS